MTSERKKLLLQRDVLESRLREQRQDVRMYQTRLSDRFNQSWIILLVILLPPFLFGWSLRKSNEPGKNLKNVLQPVVNWGVVTLISQAKEQLLSAIKA